MFEDQLYIEQIRMRLIGGETTISLAYRKIKQDTGEIQQLLSKVYRVKNENEDLIGLRRITIYAQS